MKYLGIDGGGTKTKFSLFDENLIEISSFETTTSHIGQVGEQGLFDVISSGISALCTDDDFVICASVAGYGVVREFKTRIDNVFAKHFSQYKYNIISDIESAYFGAHGLDDGIVIICGTGSIGLSYNQGEFKRVGGFGYMFSDEGSAFYIGRKLVKEFLRQTDARSDKTLIHSELMKYLQIDYEYDIFKKLNNERGEIAKLAGLCYQLAKKGDERAIGIFEMAGKSLGELISSLAVDFKRPNVAFIGGVQKSFDILLPFIEKYAGDVNFIEAKNSAEYGAVVAYLNKKKT